MRNVTRLTLKIYNGENIQPVLMVAIRIAGSTVGSTIYLTNGGEQITWGGNVYLPINFDRNDIRDYLSTESGDEPSLQMTFANVDGELGLRLGQVELDGAKITVQEIDRRILLRYPDRTRDAITLAIGEIRNVGINDQAVIFDVIQILGQLGNIQVPRRLYQPQCNYRYGSPECGAPNFFNPPNRIVTTIVSGSTDTYIRVSGTVFTTAGNPADPSDFWSMGSITIASGDAACQARQIQRVTVGGGQRRFYVTERFKVKPTPGDSVVIRRGCPKTKMACIDRQGNALNFGGFEETPYIQQKTIPPIKGYD